MIRRLFPLWCSLLLCAGCSSIFQATDEQMGRLVRLMFTPVNAILTETRHLGHTSDFRMSQGDMNMTFPAEDFREYTYTMDVTGINAVGQTVTFTAVAEIKNPHSRLPLEAPTPLVSEAISQAGTPSQGTLPTGCLTAPHLITLITWLRAIGRTGFQHCQTVRVNDTPYLVDVVFPEAKCLLLLEEDATPEVWAAHDALRAAGYTVVPLYPADFLNTIAGAQHSALSLIDACLYGIPQ